MAKVLPLLLRRFSVSIFYLMRHIFLASVHRAPSLCQRLSSGQG